jgi:4-carboxymuconolactone decarboxylase
MAKTIAAIAFLSLAALTLPAVLGSESVSAQQSAAAPPSAEKLPPDVLPETLSRVARVKREDLPTDEEKQAFDRVVAISPQDAREHIYKGWLGPSGIRMLMPEVNEMYLRENAMVRDKSGLEPKYRELAILVATRECDNKSEFIDHAQREVDRTQLGAQVIEVVRKRADTKGLEEKEALVIQFGRELFNQPKVSAKTFAAVERAFGQKATLGITLTMGYYISNALIMRAYDSQLFRRNGEPQPTAPW